jgi:hypothetical protein
VGTRDIRGRGFRTKAIRGEAIGSAARQDRQEKPRRSGARTSWKEVKMKRANTNSKIAAVLRLKRISGCKEEPRPRAGFSSFGEGGILV